MEKRRIQLQLHSGIATLITVFACLCLTIFATMTQLYARQEERLAEKTIHAAEQYYNAERRAYETLNSLAGLTFADVAHTAEALPESVKIIRQDNKASLIWTETIDENRILLMQATVDQDGVFLTAQMVKNVGAWNPGDDPSVWPGPDDDDIVIQD